MMRAWIPAGVAAGVATVSWAQVTAPAAVADPAWKTTYANAELMIDDVADID